MREGEQEVRLRRLGPGARIEVGDFVLLHRTKERTGRFHIPNDERLFQVYSAAAPGDGEFGGKGAARAFVLMDPATGSTEFEFAQPVTADRLVPVELLPLSQPLADDGARRTRVRAGGREGTVEATCVDGRVHIRWDSGGELEVVDLSRVPHEFVG